MITREEAVKEIKRELAMREQVYPRLIKNGKLHRDTARRQYKRLQAAIVYLSGDQMKATGEQKELF